jgi:hypothetical protein
MFTTSNVNIIIYLLNFWKFSTNYSSDTKSINTFVNINWKAPADPRINGGFRGLAVVPPGIEPGTPGFSVLCSTN